MALIDSEKNKNYSNKINKNVKVAKDYTIKIDPMEFKLLYDASKEEGDYLKYKKRIYKDLYNYKRRKNIKLVK